tara:strand:- start:10463 stop:11482 length:1020 start_codon:yes stop_codon:yes gene_type:complete
MLFQRNAWYVAALSSHIGRDPVRRIILGEPILLYRKDAGDVAAMFDRCPHRFAPLSRGTRQGDNIECKYHGLMFNSGGQCVLNPHGDVIAPGLHVRAYPLHEQYGFVWVWMGVREYADHGLIPDLGYMIAEGTRSAHSYVNVNYRYDILVDNLMDLSHVEYLHSGSFATSPAESGETIVETTDSTVTVKRMQYVAPPPPRHSHLPNPCDMMFTIKWHPGNVIIFKWFGVESGGDINNGLLLDEFAHIVTPETEKSVNYFMSISRYEDLDSEEMDKRLSDYQVGVIQSEDSPMLLAIDQEMDGADLLEMRPVILPVDKGALQVRRLIKRLTNLEATEQEN